MILIVVFNQRYFLLCTTEDITILKMFKTGDIMKMHIYISIFLLFYDKK